MLPIVDVPTVQYIVEEAVASGIEEILIITNSNKHCMENHFDKAYELEERLAESGKMEQVKMINDISNGLGHAVLCAKSFIGNEQFAVLLGDDVVINKGGQPALGQLVGAYNKHHASVVGVQTVAEDQVSKYGIVAPNKNVPADGRAVKLDNMVEKPKQKDAPSRMAVLGRYVLTPEILNCWKAREPVQAGRSS